MIKNYTIKSFQQLAGTLSLEEALAQLQDGYYGIVIDEQEKPFALFTTEDLQKVAKKGALLHVMASLPPTLVVGSAVEMQDFADSKAKRILLSRKKPARGAIVIDDDGVVGVLTVAKFVEYLKSSQYVRGGGELGPAAHMDGALWGSHSQMWPKICIECYHVNWFNEDRWEELEQLIENPDPNVQQQLPMCQNDASGVQPHTLKVK